MYKTRCGAIGVRDNLLLGYLSATLNLLFTMPVEVCNTRQMTGFSEGGILSIGCDLVCACALLAAWSCAPASARPLLRGLRALRTCAS